MPRGIYSGNRGFGTKPRRNKITHCRTCGVELNETNSLYMQGYLRSNCKLCHNAGEQERQSRPDSYTKTPEHKLKQKHWNLSRKFNISLEDYNELFRIQGGVCAICKRECSSGKSLAVDHNHRTNEVRGLLCEKCNQSIGALREDPEIIMNLYDYLSVTTWNKGLDKVWPNEQRTATEERS